MATEQYATVPPGEFTQVSLGKGQLVSFECPEEVLAAFYDNNSGDDWGIHLATLSSPAGCTPLGGLKFSVGLTIYFHGKSNGTLIYSSE